MPFSKRAVAMIMAFGAGVLISALSFELMDEAWETGGIIPVAIGFVAGATLFTLGNLMLSRSGASHRKSADVQERDDAADEPGGTAWRWRWAR